MNRYKRPLLCPQWWLDKDKDETKEVTKFTFTELQDIKIKTKVAREFIERNYNRLHRFNPQYQHKTPQEVCDHMIYHPNFVSLLIGYQKREQILNVSSSKLVADSLNDEGFNSLDEITTDPFIASLNTNRMTREMRLSTLLTSNTSKMNIITKFRRGYHHAPGYGTFSQYNGLLIANNCKLH